MAMGIGLPVFEVASMMAQMPACVAVTVGASVMIVG
jgi:hypothetical protein